MNYRGVLVAKTLLHRDFLKNYKKAPRTTSWETGSYRFYPPAPTSLLRTAPRGVNTSGCFCSWGQRSSHSTGKKKTKQKPHGWSHRKDTGSLRSLNLQETVHHTYSWSQRWAKGMRWCSASSHSAFQPLNLEQCLEHSRCSISNSEEEKKKKISALKKHTQ